MSRLADHKTSSDSKRWPQFKSALFILAVFGTGLGIGWTLHSDPQPTNATPRNCLRLSGYTFIQPLLTCDTSPDTDSEDFTDLKRKLESTIADAKKRGAITEASVYLRDPVTRRELSINADEKFFPASLKKVPMMMQYFKESESHPGLLQKKILITDSTDYNAGATIVPKEVAEFGKEYTIEQLIRMMIVHSDNTSFQVLLDQLGVEKFNQGYADLQLYFDDNVVLIDDYMTPYQFSLFFRTLFNATYLSRANSESALRLLSESTYKNALTKSIDDTPVAHKFGIGVVTQPGGTDQGELHDCGIVYQKDHPYLLCVMTKSLSLDLEKVEQTIADISEITFGYASRGFKP